MHGTFGTCVGPIDSIELQILAAPIISITPNLATICVNDSIVLSASGATNYTWTPSDSLSSASGVSVIAFPSDTTTYTVFGSDGNCTGISSTQINVNQLPDVFPWSDSSVCDQAIPIQLTGQPSGGTWLGENVASDGTFTSNGTGSFLLSYTFQDQQGCVDSNFRLIEVKEAAISDAGVDIEACLFEDTIQLNGFPSYAIWSGTYVDSAGNFYAKSNRNF